MSKELSMPENIGVSRENMKSLDGIKGFDVDKRIDVSKVKDSSSDISKQYDPDARIDVKRQENDEINRRDSGQNEPKKIENVKSELSEEASTKEFDQTDKTEKKGGSYKEVSNKDDTEKHHMPAASASCLEFREGSVIRMEGEDHKKTASWGSSREARAYCAKQKELVEQGKFREAVQMDIDDIREKFGDKYDDAISEMMGYIDQLEEEGKI